MTVGSYFKWSPAIFISNNCRKKQVATEQYVGICMLQIFPYKQVTLDSAAMVQLMGGDPPVAAKKNFYMYWLSTP